MSVKYFNVRENERQHSPRRITCSGGSVPQVELTLKQTACLRTSKPLDTEPKAVASFVVDLVGCHPQEHFVALYLNTQFEVLAVHTVAIGGISSTPVDLRVLYAGAIAAGATHIIVAHNHPSGEATPSEHDKELTAQIQEGAKLLGLTLLDHVVVGRGGKFTSFYEQKLLK